MSRFNQKSAGIKTTNLAGGDAYIQSPELELASILLTSMASDQFYRSTDDTFKKLKLLITQCDPLFAAKASIFARTEYGLRSITHFMASELSKSVSGKEWAKRYYEKTVHRPDDMLEIMAYHKNQGHKISAAMKKGFAKAFDKFDSYQLGKYRGEGKEFKLIDMVNIVRPIPVDRNRDALAQLVAGTLKSGDTWEKKQTQAGQKAGNEKEKVKLKADVWRDLVKNNRIGYFALLRNLRNILEQAPDVIPQACELLINEKAIKRSLVLPFRFITAIGEIQKINNDGTRQVIMAINKAIDISCNNVPKFEGKTLVVSDFSLSMGRGANSYKGQAALFSAIVAKSNNADLMVFGKNAAYVQYNPMDSTLTMVDQLLSKNIIDACGTNFHAIFNLATKAYDRIIIFSDMQGWVGRFTPVTTFNEYKTRTGADPFIYSIDLAGYGSTQFPENKIACMAGFSEKIFDTMQFVEQNKNALIDRINEIVI